MRATFAHDGVQKFSNLCEAFLQEGSEVNIGALRGVCQYSIESRNGVWLKVTDNNLVEEFMEAARRFRKPGTLVTEVKGGKTIITFQIRRG